jgi:U2 small nuclear ribonucleoprotein A'
MARELMPGLQIPVIENLASHQGSYDTLNLTDNSLTTLGNIPLATRLTAIHAANNQITTIAPSLSPNVRRAREKLLLLGLADSRSLTSSH